LSSLWNIAETRRDGRITETRDHVRAAHRWRRCQLFLVLLIFVFVPKRDDSDVVAPRAPDNRCAMGTLDVFASGFDVRFLAGMDAGSDGSSVVVEASEARERASRDIIGGSMTSTACVETQQQRWMMIHTCYTIPMSPRAPLMAHSSAMR